MANSESPKATKEIKTTNDEISDENKVMKNSSTSDVFMGVSDDQNVGNSSWHGNMFPLNPSKPRDNNFYHHYHSYIAVIFIAIVIGIILCSAIYVGIRKRRHKKKMFRGKENRKSLRRGLSRDSSQSTLSNYQSFSFRRSNNKHARLTAQRSWGDSPLTGVDSPFYDEVLNKSLPASLEPGGVHLSPLTPNQYNHDFSSGAISADTNSSTGELTRFYRQQGTFSPSYDIRSQSSTPESVTENRLHQIPLPELKSGSGIVVQIGNIDIISTVVPRNPFGEKRKHMKLPISSCSSKTSSDSLPPSLSPLDTPSEEFKPLRTISEEAPKDTKRRKRTSTSMTSDDQ